MKILKLQVAGFDAWELFQAGFDADALKEAGFDASQLKAGETTAYMDQTETCQNIGPLSVPRPPTGSGETDTRKRPFGIPGPSGAKLGDFGGEGWGAHVCYSFPRVFPW